MTDLLAAMIAAIALIGGAALGALAAHLRSQRQREQLALELERVRAQLAARVAQDAERTAAASETDQRLRTAFDSLASESLRANSELFLRMAREALSREQALAQGALKEREAAIEQLVVPLKAALERVETQSQALERERRDAFGHLRSQIETLASGQAQLQRETRNLVTALRRPEVRGRWGEITLRRVVELAGMAEHCDFTEQLHVVGREGPLRPDLVVHMPDRRDLVVDVKTPLDAYLEALEAATEEARRHALERHAQQVELRVRELAAKSYWGQLEHSPEFAVLFLPGDQFLAAALAERPELLDSALEKGVIIATPSTLIALLKAVAYGWRQTVVAQNAANIHELGTELYQRLGTFLGHVGRLGARLGSAVEAYNASVGSLERQVLPQARRFPELGVTGAAPLDVLEPIEQLPRRASSIAGIDPASADEPPAQDVRHA